MKLRRMSCRKLVLVLITSLFAACTNHYNDTIHWMDRIAPGTSMDSVKRSQPDFVTLDWAHPEQSGNVAYVLVTDIKGSHDTLNMRHELVFRDGKFERRHSGK
jgi:hypothetical protein